MNPIGIVFRRIIYAIPLKLLLVLLAIFAVFYACFSSAESFDGNIGIWNNLPAGGTAQFSSSLGDFICVSSTQSDCDDFTVSLGNVSNRGNPYQHILCVFGDLNNYAIVVNNNTNYSCPFYNIRGYISDFQNNICTTMSSLECQTEYNLIPISSVDQNYCTTNNLCPTYDCPTNPIGTGTLSNLYINNILHIGAPNIIMNIPEEIDWDYAYTQGGNTMNIDVVGYNQDQEMIQGWIDTNNYKPSSDDFTNIFTSGFSNFGGLLIATLFVILVFYFVKKMFK